ncbi:hypothetical protein LDHU3_33.4700:CDS1 [Leishmania donovani]|uniref:Hypothetical_protein n=1 Tax=Leishmania donovani TaxID=5661 RepID=A0A3S7X799_LEIDO|nr:hypothetical protein LdCL_330039700 [Leishmania donovani]CAJ1992311.1 hypothetical protein LDHU3_33.4700:CDS1 [Leishmania donovani]VDZ48146.1 hypothetical_protein [Leishmania donovani]
MEFLLGSLVVDVELVHAPSLDRKEIDARLSVFELPRTWGVHLDSTANKGEGPVKRIATHHRVKPESGEWGTLLAVQFSELEATFVNDVGASLKLPKEVITSLTFRMGNLLVDM